MKALLFLSLFACASLISCTKDNGTTKTTTPKTTGHIYCALAGNHTLYRFGQGHDTITWLRTSNFDVSLLQNSVLMFDKKSSKDSVTIDMGEWNPGTYELHSSVSFSYSRKYPYNLQCDTTFQVQANVDQTIKMSEWYQ